jgi:hypothetical protein
VKLSPLSVVISTRDTRAGKEVQQQYLVHSRHPRWELLKIFLRAFFTIRFR